jgi:hypothetical protein
MISSKTKLTNRKFYGKWIYKVTLCAEGCTLLRVKTLDEIKEFCLNGETDSPHYSIWAKAHRNRETLVAICNFLEKENKSNYATRIERNYVDFYTNDKNFYTNISNTFQQLVKHRYEPDQTNLDILSQSNSITVKKLPKNRYNYRVYLLPHKMAGDKEGKRKYIDWMKQQSPKITCTDAIEKWFISTEWNWDRRYVLVEDERTLLLLKLRNSDVVGRIYNFVVTDK